MYLKRLELQGFKSFVDRTIITFDSGITGVVGPNGCGKSNIVDAIVWVMGETSAKHLRGEKMSDVIFSGSSSRPATSMAEVTLVMEGVNHCLPPHLAHLNDDGEVSVTRRLFRDGTTEYLINKTTVRMRDIHELFMDSGVGKRSYAIIEQGQISRMISLKPEDRRVVFEEVAGITKYRAKKKEAQKKIEQTEANISRVDDIIRELEKQLRSLKIQAGKAAKYREIKIELEEIEKYLLRKKLSSTQQTIQTAEIDLSEQQDQLTGVAAQLGDIEARLTDLDVKRLDVEKNLQTLEQEERSLSHEHQVILSEIQLIEEKKRSGSAQVTTLTEQLSDIKLKLSELTESKQTTEKTLTDLQSSLEGSQEFVKTHQETIDLQTHEISELTRNKEKLSSQLQESERELVRLESAIEHSVSDEEQVYQQGNQLNQKVTQLIKVMTESRDQVQFLEQDLETKEQELATKKTELEDYESSLKVTQEDLKVKTEEYQEFQKEYHRTQSKLESLQDLKESYEGYSDGTKEVLKKYGEDLKLRPLGDFIQPKPLYEKAVEVLLGKKLESLMSEDSSLESQVFFQDGMYDLGRVSFMFPGSSPSGDINLGDKILPFTELMSSHTLDVHPQLVQLFSRYGLVSQDTDLISCLELCREQQLKVISLESFSVVDQGVWLDYGKSVASSGVFARKREIDELSDKQEGLVQSIQRAEKEKKDLQEELDRQEEKKELLRITISEFSVECAAIQKEKESKQREWDHIDKEYTSFQKDLEANTQKLDQIRELLETSKTEKEKTSSSIVKCETELSKVTENLLVAEDVLRQKSSQLDNHKIDLSRFEERYQSTQDRLKDMSSELKRSQTEQERFERQKQELIQESDGFEGKEKEFSEREKEVVKLRDSAIETLNKVKENFRELTDELTELQQNRVDVYQEKDKLSDCVKELELILTQVRADHQYAAETIKEKYDESLFENLSHVVLDKEKISFVVDQYKLTWDTFSEEEKDPLLTDRLDELKQKISKYGEVNLMAIQEYDEVEKRHEFLMDQKSDLEKSLSLLEEAIDKIDETSQKRFKETFVSVNTKFKEVFPILFNGGKARLSLTNPDNIAESGIDVLAQPPGKKLQSITLLSGGEKALTAVSLILAIFARRPSPFCLLDEVDAPLDEANVSRFNTVIKKMAEKSQFIVVTHNRKTMNIADALFGVTMENAGVSKMTSVQLS